MAEEEDEDNSDSLAEADVGAGASKCTGVEITVAPVGGSTRGTHGELMADGSRWVRIAASRSTKKSDPTRGNLDALVAGAAQRLQIAA